MKPVIGVAEMHRLDAEAPVPVDALMDAAGYGISIAAAEMGGTYGSTVHVLCGGGNNGGDGYVAAKYLHRRGARVVVHYLGLPDPDSAAGRALDAAAAAGIRFAPLGDVEPGDLVIDALFGTGFRGELPSEAVAWTSTAAPVLSVDVPSGLDGDSGSVAGRPVFRADRTVTFHALKPCHVLGNGPDVCGRVTVLDIGLEGGDAAMGVVEHSDIRIEGRGRQDHKWRAGAVATVGGMMGFTGAALLAARTALRSGAGVSSILTTDATASIYETLAPDITAIQASEARSWFDHSSEILGLLGRYDVLVVGPGLEPSPPHFVDRLLAGFDRAMVVDAGAIGGIERLDTVLERSAPTVLTPHAGEFTRLTGMEPSHESAMRLADAIGAVVVLKGNPTFIAGRGLAVVNTGGPELATMGTGDVLAGLIAALMATDVGAEESAQMGAYIHGVAGARVAAGQTVIATDLVDEVGRIVADERRLADPDT
jgi:hydroxyethylthiazole kinase-like uncharacterized protein yjeF